MEGKLVVAADFGNDKIAIAVARKDEQNHIEIVDFRQIKSDDSLISNGKIVDKLSLSREVIAMIKQIENDNNLQIDRLHFAVSPHTLRSEIRKVSVDMNGSQADANEALITEAESIDISKSRCVFDVAQLETSFGDKAEGNFLVIAAQNNVQLQFMEFISSFLNAYKPKYFVAPLIEAQHFLSNEQKRNKTLLVDIGAGCTSFVAYHNKFPRLCAVLPLGSKNISDDIEKTFNVSENNAETLKVGMQYGLAIGKDLRVGEIKITAEELKKVITSRLDEIFKFIFDELKSQKIDNINEIVLVGGGAKMKLLPEYLEKFSGIKTRIANFNVTATDEHRDFNSLQNALLFALLNDCDEVCGRYITKNEPQIEPKQETEKEKKQRLKDEERMKKLEEKEKEKEEKKKNKNRGIRSIFEEIVNKGNGLFDIDNETKIQ